MPDEDMQKRVAVFLKEYGELVEKHKIDFVQYPMFVPSGEGKWEIIVQNQPIDTTNQPVKSPFIQ